jgi:hypothetical protein
MTSARLTSPVATPNSNSIATQRGDTTTLAIAIAFTVSLALCWGNVRGIWLTGDFHDSDDAMRMVQVRDFLGGQSWYDLTAWRLDPPRGSFMHWSRVVDVPLALLMKLFASETPGDAGERLARIVFPLLLQVGLLASMAWIGRILFGARGVPAVLALTVLSGFMLGQFVPGRVDHHAPQIVLLMLMIGSMLAALDPARARFAALSAVCAALSLSISVENLPFILVLCAAPPMAWMMAGASTRPMLRWFAAALAISTPVCFAVFNAPSRWLAPACDAFSYDHVFIALGAALVCGAMSLATKWDGSLRVRIFVGVALGCVVGAPLAVFSMPCLVDPFAGLDPLVRDIWLNNVGEARPALKNFAINPRSFQMIAIPTLLGLIGLLAAISREAGIARVRFVLILAFAFAGVAATTFMIRASTSLAPIALLGCAWIVMRLMQALSERPLGGGLSVAISVIATLPFSSIGWAMVPTILPDQAETRNDMAACLPAVNFEALSRLPRGLVLAPVDIGSHLLAHTAHAVVAAPYHRNNRGNRLGIDIFMASPDEARDNARGAGLDYIVVCQSAKELVTIAARAPNSLAARLIDGNAPGWLAPIATAGGPIRIYGINKH